MRLICFALAAVLTTPHISAAPADEQLDLAALARIRDEALNRSQLMDTVSYLADVVGPRLTGSPALLRGEEYARDRLKAVGLINAHLEPWGPFGRGWTLERFSASMTAPDFMPLIAYPKAWSPGTNGAVRADAVILDVKTLADLEKYRGKLRGRIVLWSPVRAVDAVVRAPQRQSDEALRALEAMPPPAPRRPAQLDPEMRAAEQLNYDKWQLVQREGAAAVLTAAPGDHGTVYVTAATVPYPPDVPFNARPGAWSMTAPALVPQIAVSAEQYNRLVRLAERGVPVQVAIDVGVRFHTADTMAYNVIADLPGTDLAREVVMIGGCIDSWHTATGATDNAAGAATAIEAVRIIHALGLHPRRTIRVGLWSAEEQGRLGSPAYVAAHFARGLPDNGTLAGYFNLDYGSGRIRGIYTHGNTDVVPIFKAWLEPLRDLGVSTVSLADVGADDESFDEAGLPGFQFIRDYMEGRDSRVGHTNMDVLDHVLVDDLKQSAAVAASFIYTLSMRDQPLPRKR
ncbi:MAG TPA: M20/M25/M40 family metallo-hydrolase [Vicinamibacterales bacterium]|nr:M20/M25/M40 family metallo-hydrolase [Vicinamibacterales bacterium]